MSRITIDMSVPQHCNYKEGSPSTLLGHRSAWILTSSLAELATRSGGCPYSGGWHHSWFEFETKEDAIAWLHLFQEKYGETVEVTRFIEFVRTHSEKHVKLCRMMRFAVDIEWTQFVAQPCKPTIAKTHKRPF